MFPRLRRLFSTTTLSSLSPNPNPDKPLPLNTIVNNLFNERSLDRLVASFKLHSHTYRFRCRHRIYDSAVGRLAAASRRDSVREILDFQKQFKDDFKRGDGFAIRLISLYGKAGMVDDAKRTFDELEEIGGVKSVKVFNAVLTVFVECGEFERVVEAVREAEKEEDGVELNGVSFNILIKALCNQGNFDAALETLEVMRKNGFPPCLITYNTLLNAFYGNGRLADAEKTWDRMKEEKIEPDTMSFNAKMRGLVSEGKTLEAAKLVDELKQLGLKPDTFTYNALMKGYCNDGNMMEAKKVYINLTKNGCSPNRGTFGILIPSLCEAGELDMALQLCKENMSRRRMVDADYLQGLVNGLVKASRIDEAKNLVELGRENGYSKKNLNMPFK